MYSECAKQVNVQKYRDHPTPQLNLIIPLQHNMPFKNDERELTSAIQAIQRDPTLRLYAVAKTYSEDHRKLARRLHGMQPRCDIIANSRKLSNLEESVLVQYILDLAAKGFPP